jgi:hypothetical protein
VKVREQVVDMTEKMVKQLEGLAFSKHRDLALKLTGGVEALIHILEESADHWNKRVQQANLDVMKDKEVPVAFKLGVVPPIATIPAVLTEIDVGMPPQI